MANTYWQFYLFTSLPLPKTNYGCDWRGLACMIVLVDVARADRMQAKCSWREPGSGRPHGHVPKEEGGA